MLRGRQDAMPLRALLAIALAAGTALAQPCPDEPSMEGLGCRVDALAVRGGADAAAVAGRMRHAREACAASQTTAARRELRGMGRPLARLGKDADVLVTDALRRATIDRLARRPCPELAVVLSPRWNEHVRDGELFVLIGLAADADPATLAVRLGDAAPAPLDPADVSATPAWVRIACDPAGRQLLRVSVRSRDGAAGDVEQVPVTCGGEAVLGAEVEALVTPDYMPERLRVTPVRPLRAGASYALVA